MMPASDRVTVGQAVCATISAIASIHPKLDESSRPKAANRSPLRSAGAVLGTSPLSAAGLQQSVHCVVALSAASARDLGGASGR